MDDIPRPDSDDEGIFDRDALEAAERAAHDQRDDEAGSPTAGQPVAHIDEPMVAVARAADWDPDRSLEPVYAVLREAGIPAGFDPYRPGEASSPYGFLSRTVSVVVPQSFERRARDILREADVVLPGEATQPSARVYSDTSPREHAVPSWSDAGVPEGRQSRLSWRIILVVLAVLVALAVLIAGLVSGPFLGR